MTRTESEREDSRLTSLDHEVMGLFSAELTEQNVDESAIEILIESYKEARAPSGDVLLSRFKQVVDEAGAEEGK